MNQARSRAIDRLRLEHRKKRVDPSGDDPLPSSSPSPSPHETMELGELRSVLRSALNVLTPDERQAIETAFFFDLTHTKIAERLNQPLGTIKTRIRSAL